MKPLKVALAAACAVVVGWAFTASAEARVWTGDAGDGRWENDGNWSPTGVPQAGDTATVGTGAAVTLSSATPKLGLVTISGAKVLFREPNRALPAAAGAGVAQVKAEFHARDLSPIVDAQFRNGAIVAVKDGRPLMPIVYSEDNGYRTLQAVKFLARCIEKATGVKPPVVKDDGRNFMAPAFYVGDRVSAVRRQDVLVRAGLAQDVLTADITNEEFAVTAADGSYWFRGRSDHAVYDFCERVLGARWYWSGEDGLYVPQSADLLLPQWSWRDRPVFLMRYNWPDFHTDYGRYLRDSTRGPLALYPELHVHSSGGYKSDTNFNFGVRCPEIYELDADGRRGTQFCFGNPRTLEAYEEIIRKGIDNKLAKISILDFPSKSITVSQLDCGVSCHCEFCKKLYDEKLGPTGNASPCIWGHFVKNLSEWVADHYPDWTIVILPYINTCACPDGLTFPRKNVVAMLCTMPGLALLKNERVREQEEGLILKWAKATGRQVENWHYSCWPNAFTCAPYVYSSVANGHYRRMAKEGAVIGSFLNGGYQANRYFLSIAVWMKSLWNPDFDVKAYHDGFAKRMFGPAERPMRRVVELLEKGWSRQWGNNQCSNRNVYEVSYPRAEVEEMERCFAEATELVKPLDAVYRRRIDFWREGCAEFFKGSAAHAKGTAYEPVRVQKVTDQPKIDGVLDDTAWKLAIPSKFVPAFNKDPKAKLRDGGELRAVWTPQGVTFGFRCDEHAIEHFQKTAAKMSFGNETLDIFIDPSGEGADIVCQLVIDARDTIVPLRDEVRQTDMEGFEAKWHVDVPNRQWSCELYIPYAVFRNFKGAKFPTTSANGVVWEGNVSRWRIGDSALPKDKRPKDATWEASRLWTRHTWFNKDAAAFGKFMFVE